MDSVKNGEAMETQTMNADNHATPVDYRCPKHPNVNLWNVLKGGAGYCSKCFLYVQAAGVPMPTLPPRPPAVAKPKRKRSTKKVTAKKRMRKPTLAKV